MHGKGGDPATRSKSMAGNPAVRKAFPIPKKYKKNIDKLKNSNIIKVSKGEKAMFEKLLKMRIDRLWKLRQEVTIGSCFLKDYSNDMGISESDAVWFFDGYVDYLYELSKGSECRWPEDFDSIESLREYRKSLAGC